MNAYIDLGKYLHSYFLQFQQQGCSGEGGYKIISFNAGPKAQKEEEIKQNTAHTEIEQDC